MEHSRRWVADLECPSRRWPHWQPLSFARMVQRPCLLPSAPDCSQSAAHSPGAAGAWSPPCTRLHWPATASDSTQYGFFKPNSVFVIKGNEAPFTSDMKLKLLDSSVIKFYNKKSRFGEKCNGVENHDNSECGNVYLLSSDSKCGAHVFIVCTGQCNVCIHASILVCYRHIAVQYCAHSGCLWNGEWVRSAMELWSIVIDVQNWNLSTQRYSVGFWSCNAFIWKPNLPIILLT